MLGGFQSGVENLKSEKEDPLLLTDACVLWRSLMLRLAMDFLHDSLSFIWNVNPADTELMKAR